MKNEDLTENQTPEEVAAEEAAFSAAFSGERGTEEAEVAPAPEAEAEAEATPEGEAPPEAEAEAGETPKTVLAGLTEDQITQVLGRVSQQQMTIDKLGGRIGQLMQQVEKLKEQPRTVAEQRSFDLKLEKLSTTFPELAEILKEDLKGLGIGAGSGDAPAQPGQTFTAEDVDKIVTQKLSAFKQQQERGIEVKMLGSAHPDWEQVIRTPQFALWRDNVIADGKDLMESENAQFISRKLTEFKDWVKATTSPVHQPQQQPQQRSSAEQGSVAPSGHAGRCSGPEQRPGHRGRRFRCCIRKGTRAQRVLMSEVGRLAT